MAYPDDLRIEVDRYLNSLQFDGDPAAAGLIEAMRYSLLAPGKRVRPVLVLATARALGQNPKTFLPLATSTELIHAYSLIHDDLPAMDDDDLRRGRPTCHKAFGENVAILAGDGLYAEAFALLLRDQQAEPARLLKATQRLASATGVAGMVAGQYIDVAERAEPGLDGLRRMHELKTGRLIGACIECPLDLADVEDEVSSPLREFAGELGVLFQIVDDILDVTGSDDELGKPQGSDAKLGKRTYISEHGLDQARKLASQSYDRARASLLQAFRKLPEGGRDLEQITEFIYTRTS